MSTRKTQNSVLFLATLGVYLGLVLTGATPVLGHAATARQFDLRDEIEFADEFDNKPDDETPAFSLSIKNYLEDVEAFLGTLRQLESERKFDRVADTFEVAQSTLLPCVPANATGNYTAEKFQLRNEALRPALERFSKLLTDGYSLAECLPNAQFADKDVTHSRFNVRLAGDALCVEVSIRRDGTSRAQVTAAELTAVRGTMSASDISSLRRTLLEHTNFRAENDRVQITTSLPRASLLAVPTNDAK